MIDGHLIICCACAAHNGAQTKVTACARALLPGLACERGNHDTVVVVAVAAAQDDKVRASRLSMFNSLITRSRAGVTVARFWSQHNNKLVQ